MKKVIILSFFERSVKKLSCQDRTQLSKRLELFNSFLLSGQVPFGFRFKKINHDKYEFRINIRIRVIVKVDGDNYYLVLVGCHNDVKRYLRRFR